MNKHKIVKESNLHPIIADVVRAFIPPAEKWDCRIDPVKSERYDFFDRLREDLDRAFQTTTSKEAAHVFYMAEITCKEEMQRIFPAVDESEHLPEV